MSDFKSLQACRMAPRGTKNTQQNGRNINCDTLFNRASGVSACQPGPDGNETICNMALQKRGHTNNSNTDNNPFTKMYSN